MNTILMLLIHLNIVNIGIQFCLHINRKYLFSTSIANQCVLSPDRHIWRGGFLLSVSIIERYLWDITAMRNVHVKVPSCVVSIAKY